RHRQHELRGDGHARRRVRLCRAVLRGRVPERRRHAGDLGRATLHLLGHAGVPALRGRGPRRARHRPARARDGRDPPTGGVRALPPPGGHPAPAPLARAERDAVPHRAPVTGRRLLLVVQRYGAEVVGGSEQHARLAARRLARRHTVEVATTTALDYWTWDPYYVPGDVVVDGIRV